MFVCKRYRHVHITVQVRHYKLRDIYVSKNECIITKQGDAWYTTRFSG
jgi:hypothetical protein